MSLINLNARYKLIFLVTAKLGVVFSCPLFNLHRAEVSVDRLRSKTRVNDHHRDTKMLSLTGFEPKTKCLWQVHNWQQIY